MMAGVHAAHKYQSETPRARVGQNANVIRLSAKPERYDWPVLMNPNKVMKAK